MPPIVKVTNLDKYFGRLHVLKNISIGVQQREVVCLIGRSGSGKSTLLRCINFLEEPSDGTIEVDGIAVHSYGRGREHRQLVHDVRLKTGMVFQEFNLFPHMSVLENVLEGQVTVKGMDRAQAVALAEENLDSVGMLFKKDEKETNGTALFGLIYGEHLLVVGKREGNQNIGITIRLGHRFHITLGAHGKAIVAFLPEADRERILTKKRVFFHGLDISRLNRKRLREEPSKCRQLGYAQDVGEVTQGVHLVSAPVFGVQEKIIGCIILIGTFAENLIGKYGPKTADVARQISYKLGADIKSFSKVGKGNHLERAA